MPDRRIWKTCRVDLAGGQLLNAMLHARIDLSHELGFGAWCGLNADELATLARTHGPCWSFAVRSHGAADLLDASEESAGRAKKSVGRDIAPELQGQIARDLFRLRHIALLSRIVARSLGA